MYISYRISSSGVALVMLIRLRSSGFSAFAMSLKG